MKSIFLQFLLTTIAVSSFAQTQEQPTTEQTNSEKYGPYVVDAQKRMAYTTAQGTRLTRTLKASANYKTLASRMMALYDVSTLRKEVSLGTSKIQWVDTGINKASNISKVNSDGTSELIYSNFQEEIGIAAQIWDFFVSPGNRYLNVNLSEYGSINQAKCVVIDLQSKEVVTVFGLGFNSTYWSSPTTLTYYKLNDDGRMSYATLDLTTNVDTAMSGSVVGSTTDALLIIEGGQYKIQNIQDGTKKNIKLTAGDHGTRPVGSDGTNFYVLVVDAKSGSQILKYDRTSQDEEIQPQVIVTESLFIDKVFADKDAVFVQARNGADRVLRYYTPNGEVKFETTVPNCCNVLDVAWATPQASVRVRLASAVTASEFFVFDINQRTWNREPDQVMLSRDGIDFVSEVQMSTSADGTQIPARIFRRKDLAANSNNPVHIWSYGGFNSAGYLDPRYDAAVLEFLKKGGIAVGTGIRGGNESGPAWHLPAVFTGKIKTFEDLNSIAQELVKTGWTKPDLIASRGTSNGGLTVAATGLLNPDNFGMIIPVSGVLDMLGKDQMDSVYNGWAYEYGAVSQYHDFLASISPLELVARQGNLKFLILDGMDDTRVNAGHSVKLAKALQDLGGHPENVHLFTAHDSGHWLESVSFQNAIGVKSQIVIWSMIYDMAGWQPPALAPKDLVLQSWL